MKSSGSVGQAIYQSIEEEKWLYITYDKPDGRKYFWMEVSDILPKEKTILGKMRNFHLSDEIRDARISFDRIEEAVVLDFTKATPAPALWDRLNRNSEDYAWLDYPHFDNNILLYLRDCRLLDGKPEQKQYALIDGIELNRFQGDKAIKLTPEQQKRIATKVLAENRSKKPDATITLALSALSLDSGRSKYIVAYHAVSFQLDKGSLVLDPELQFNGDVWAIEDDSKTTPLSAFLTAYAKEVKTDPNAASEKLKSELCYEYGRKYTVDTRPEMMLLERKFHPSYDKTFTTIQKEYEEKTLPYSLKAFFGMSTKRGEKKIEPSIVLYDEKADIDQMRAVYNAMKQPVTYVQGPPGTGKTQTLLNVVLSQLLNGRTILMTSQNNKPVDDIIDKLSAELFYEGQKIDFPYLRIGNAANRIKACQRILQFYEKELPNASKEDEGEELSSIREENNRLNHNLLSLLEQDERHGEIAQQLAALSDYEREVLTSKETSELADELQERKESLQSELSKNPKPTDETARKLFSPAGKSQRFLKFLFDQSVLVTKRLKSGRFQDLIQICYIMDEEDRQKSFRKWLAVDQNVKKLLSIFPVIFSTNISCGDLGSGKPYFDMVVMDEAGQCNAADALFPLARGNRLLMVGDPKQLSPVIQLSPVANSRLMKKYGVPPSYDYLKHSILEMMLANDKFSNDILLEYHYRCGIKIIAFPNQLYYEGRLKLDKLHDMGKLELFDCKNFGVAERNTAVEEAKACVAYLERNGCRDTTILTPFVNQAALINRMIAEKGLKGVKAVSVHKMQGSESGTILFSLAISAHTSKYTWNWLKNNRELINVAMTRAKKAFVLFADTEAAGKLGDGKEDISKLIGYVKSNGKANVIGTEAILDESRFANQSLAEREFAKTVRFFCTCHPGFLAKRNMMTYEVFPDDPVAKRMRGNFDLVLYASMEDYANHRPALVFEINGGEHLGDFSAEQRDVRKANLCKKHSVQELAIPNCSVKDYMMLHWLVEDYAKHREELAEKTGKPSPVPPSLEREEKNRPTAFANAEPKEDEVAETDQKPKSFPKPRKGFFRRLLSLFKKR